MKKICLMIIVLVMCAATWVFAQHVYRNTPEHARYLSGGAKAKLTLKIVDEEGLPVVRAQIRAHFQMAGRDGIVGTSNTNGLFAMEDKSRWKMHYGVEKEGYYKTSGEYMFGNDGDLVIKDGKWQPWDPEVRVVLRPVVNPIPMYASRVDIEIPVKGESVGFDLEKGDWVDPYGRGEKKDMLVYLEEEVLDAGEWHKKLILTFGTNAPNGVVRLPQKSFSAYVSPYLAPEAGYGRSIAWEYKRTKDKVLLDARSSSDDCLIYRIRTEVDKDGNIVRANYGKIYGPVEFGLIGPKSILRMTFYFNPEENSRNMEFDPKKNLFKDLKSTEEVSAP